MKYCFEVLVKVVVVVVIYYFVVLVVAEIFHSSGEPLNIKFRSQHF